MRRKQESEDAALLLDWVCGMALAMGKGGKAAAAARLGITASGLSHMLHVPGRSFDQKTMNAVAWIQASRNETDTPAVIERKQVGAQVFELRATGEWTWRRGG
ncbi:MAG: hypothetical protein LBK60_01415 [Verrucomicrobiales bacterium]|jgi:hypothetical protein|nr:hypothetical protein [Verrucomicrobiales bacterium]